MYWYDHDMGWWGYAGMGIGIVLFWVLLIAGIVALVAFVNRDGGDRHAQWPEPQSPEQILASRFARGEISETEYLDRLGVLRNPVRR